MTQLYDIAILGAVPAGIAAAWRLAKKGCDVIVVDTPRHVVECPLCDWVGKDFFKHTGFPKSLGSKCGVKAFKSVVYHNAALDKLAEHHTRATAGFFLHPAKLSKALHDEAKSAGVKFHTAKTPPEIDLGEREIHLLGSKLIRAKLLLIAHNRPTEVAAQLALASPIASTNAMTITGLDIPLNKKALPFAPADALHVVELPSHHDLGVFFTLGKTLHLRIISALAGNGEQAGKLAAMISSLQQAGVIPKDLPLDRADGSVWNPPAGVALELETHVFKRCLLIGTAGGFVEAATGQTLAASIRSALLAAETALEMLHSSNHQESLMHFKDSWRNSLADFIRPPNTSLRMLLPLLFTNKKIVARFTAAFLDGENI